MWGIWNCHASSREIVHRYISLQLSVGVCAVPSQTVSLFRTPCPAPLSLTNTPTAMSLTQCMHVGYSESPIFQFQSSISTFDPGFRMLLVTTEGFPCRVWTAGYQYRHPTGPSNLVRDSNYATNPLPQGHSKPTTYVVGPDTERPSTVDSPLYVRNVHWKPVTRQHACQQINISRIMFAMADESSQASHNCRNSR